MLSMITGKQRAGKTYYCVNLIIQHLRHYQARPIYTNLPLNPDVLARYAAGRDNAKFADYLRRIYLFIKFRRLSDAKSFHRKNPAYIAINRIDRAVKKQYLSDTGVYIFPVEYFLKRFIYPQECIVSFWRFTRPNAVIFLDEIYQWFHNSNAFSRDNDVQDARRELLTYARQHGHSKDDLFLISHDMNDVDANIRRGVQYLYIIRNSKYTNVFKNKWLRGLKWPYQFFIVEGYEFGEVEPSDSWRYPTVKRIFDCYNSFSAAETLKKDGVSTDSVSSDTGVNFWYNFKRFVSQAWMGLALIGGFAIGGYMIYSFFMNEVLAVDSKSVQKSLYGDSKSSDPAGSSSSGSSVSLENLKSVSSDSLSLPTDKVSDVPLVPEVADIVAVSPLSVTWSDGFKLIKGQNYHGLHVHQITKDFIVFINRADSIIYRVEVSGSRDYTKNPVRQTGSNFNQQQRR